LGEKKNLDYQQKENKMKIDKYENGEVTETSIIVENEEDAKAVRYLEKAIYEQLEACLDKEEAERAIEAILSVFDREGNGVFASYEKLLIPNLE
jgi:hypothetical protein